MGIPTVRFYRSNTLRELQKETPSATNAVAMTGIVNAYQLYYRLRRPQYPAIGRRLGCNVGSIVFSQPLSTYPPIYVGLAPDLPKALLDTYSTAGTVWSGTATIADCKPRPATQTR